MPKTPKSDPTKDAEFQSVVKHFLNTKPKPHKKSIKSKKGSAEAKP
jgi:hypothetical protein